VVRITDLAGLETGNGTRIIKNQPDID